MLLFLIFNSLRLDGGWSDDFYVIISDLAFYFCNKELQQLTGNRGFIPGIYLAPSAAFYLQEVS